MKSREQTRAGLFFHVSNEIETINNQLKQTHTEWQFIIHFTYWYMFVELFKTSELCSDSQAVQNEPSTTDNPPSEASNHDQTHCDSQDQNASCEQAAEFWQMNCKQTLAKAKKALNQSISQAELDDFVSPDKLSELESSLTVLYDNINFYKQDDSSQPICHIPCQEAYQKKTLPGLN